MAKKTDRMARLKLETAREPGLEDDLKNGGKKLSTFEAGKIGGNMIKKLVRAGQESMDKVAGTE
ncbi:MAG: small, acid-soluble spore protein, alpha/beta type [Bacillota bacterium]